MGIGVFYLTKNAFARSWIFRSYDLSSTLKKKSYRVLEVFTIRNEEGSLGREDSFGEKVSTEAAEGGEGILECVSQGGGCPNRNHPVFRTIMN